MSNFTDGQLDRDSFGGELSVHNELAEDMYLRQSQKSVTSRHSSSGAARLTPRKVTEGFRCGSYPDAFDNLNCEAPSPESLVVDPLSRDSLSKASSLARGDHRGSSKVNINVNDHDAEVAKPFKEPRAGMETTIEARPQWPLLTNRGQRQASWASNVSGPFDNVVGGELQDEPLTEDSQDEDEEGSVPAAGYAATAGLAPLATCSKSMNARRDKSVVYSVKSSSTASTVRESVLATPDSVKAVAAALEATVFRSSGHGSRSKPPSPRALAKKKRNSTLV